MFAVPAILEMMTEYYYLDFLMLKPIDADHFESEINKDLFIKGVLVYPEIRTNDGEKGEYDIDLSLLSHSNNSVVRINNVFVKIIYNNTPIALTIQEMNSEDFHLSTINYTGDYSSCPTIGKFVIDFDDVNIDDIGLLELTVNLSVKNGDKFETKEIKCMYRPQKYRSSVVTDYLLRF